MSFPIPLLSVASHIIRSTAVDGEKQSALNKYQEEMLEALQTAEQNLQKNLKLTDKGVPGFPERISAVGKPKLDTLSKTFFAILEQVISSKLQSNQKQALIQAYMQKLQGLMSPLTLELTGELSDNANNKSNGLKSLANVLALLRR